MYTEEFVFNTCKFSHHPLPTTKDLGSRFSDELILMLFIQRRPLDTFLGIQNCTWFQRKDLVNKQQWPEIRSCSIRMVACCSGRTNCVIYKGGWCGKITSNKRTKYPSLNAVLQFKPFPTDVSGKGLVSFEAFCFVFKQFLGIVLKFRYCLPVFE